MRLSGDGWLGQELSFDLLSLLAGQSAGSVSQPGVSDGTANQKEVAMMSD
jgi:hypothetical protein